MKNKSYNRMEMLVELKRDNSKVFRNEMGTEFYVNSEGELKGRTTVGRIYSPELMFRTETEYYEVPKLFKERIKKGDNYYYVDCVFDTFVKKYPYSGDEFDLRQIKNGNFFETREEAEIVADKILNVLKGDNK